jgi:hypothetical protein
MIMFILFLYYSLEKYFLKNKKNIIKSSDWITMRTFLIFFRSRTLLNNTLPLFHFLLVWIRSFWLNQERTNLILFVKRVHGWVIQCRKAKHVVILRWCNKLRLTNPILGVIVQIRFQNDTFLINFRLLFIRFHTIFHK